MQFHSNILICYQARGTAGFLDLQRFVKLIYMFSEKRLNIYVLSRESISKEILNLDFSNPNIKIYNISFFQAIKVRTKASIFIMPNLLDSLIMFARKIFFRDFNSQFAVIHNPPLQLSSRNILINILGISMQFIFYLFSDINIYLSDYVSSKWINFKKSLVQLLPDLNPCISLKNKTINSQKVETKFVKLLIIGRWLPYKNLYLLIGALNKIKNSELEQNILITIHGSSYPSHEISSLIKSTNNKNIKIEYNDIYIPNSEVDQLLLSCDYCLFLYKRASQSGFLQRCKELGVPVICTKVGGLEEYLINGAIGHAVHPDYESIKKIITNISHSYPYQYNGNFIQSKNFIDYLISNHLKE